MSSFAVGRLVDEDDAPWVGLTIVTRHMSAVYPSQKAREQTGADGRFTIRYGPDPFADRYAPRILEFRVFDDVRRLLFELKRWDVRDNKLDLGDIELKRADVTGYLVTLGTGVATSLTTGNALRLLIDNVEAFGHLDHLFKKCKSLIHFTQLFFELPATFKAQAADEDPALVFEFHQPTPQTNRLRAINPDDSRPERVLIKRAKDDSVDVKVLLWDPTLGAEIVAALGLIIGAGWLVLLAWWLRGQADLSHVDNAKRYFGGAAVPIGIRGFDATIVAVMHAKLAIVDDKSGVEAVNLASPFRQSYFDDPGHDIDDPCRGPGDDQIKHDVSMSVRGPAVADVHEFFRLHWNAAGASDPVAAIERPKAQTSGGDAIAALQVVRTLPSGRFANPSSGEAGILEAYLRAVASARHFIYCENQYVTSDVIGSALQAALKDPGRPNLAVILLVNIDHDIWLYPRWQRRLFQRIRKGLSDSQRERFGVFTRWIHEPGEAREQRKPRIMPCYLHSKVAIVDDAWATIGSANLDGSSLDGAHVASVFRDLRASEANFVLLNDVDGQPPSSAVALLRRRLWAEHLGFESSPGVPDPTHPALAAPAAGKSWLDLWNERANTKLDGLVTDPTHVYAGDVLPWPNVDKTLDDPAKHLSHLGDKDRRIDLTKIDPIRGRRGFNLKKGTWQAAAPTVDG